MQAATKPVNVFCNKVPHLNISQVAMAAAIIAPIRMAKVVSTHKFAVVILINHPTIGG